MAMDALAEKRICKTPNDGNVQNGLTPNKVKDAADMKLAHGTVTCEARMDMDRLLIMFKNCKSSLMMPDKESPALHSLCPRFNGTKLPQHGLHEVDALMFWNVDPGHKVHVDLPNVGVKLPAAHGKHADKPT